MSFKFVKRIVLVTVISGLAACSQLKTTPTDLASKEALYYNTKNYNNLISLYRSALKEKDDAEMRYKLANVYYRIGDIKSSQFYLRPVVNANVKNDLNLKASLLQIRNSIKLKQYGEAVKLSRQLQTKYPKEAEVYLLQGQSYALIGNYQQAKLSFEKARSMFINDTVILNDMAVLAILENNYQEAVDILLPAYQNGMADSRMLHNLVFALAKNRQETLAKEIVVHERLNTSPDDLIDALKNTARHQ